MPLRKTRPPQDQQEQPWESGWGPDTSRAPGTRRLWLAGLLAVATVITCVTAITVMDNSGDQQSRADAKDPTTDATGPGLISFATPSASRSATPGHKSHKSPSHTPKSSPRPDGSASAAPVDTPESPAPHTSAPHSSKPAVTWRSVRSVNYPDRYWHVSGGYVKLDPVGGSESREDSTFKLVKGLADSSCYSFATHDGKYLRHRSFVLRAESNDGSSLFQQDATFCARASSYSGAVMFESVNYPGRFLRHQNFQLKLDPYQYSGLYQADSAFRLVDGLS